MAPIDPEDVEDTGAAVAPLRSQESQDTLLCLAWIVVVWGWLRKSKIWARTVIREDWNWPKLRSCQTFLDAYNTVPVPTEMDGRSIASLTTLPCLEFGQPTILFRIYLLFCFFDRSGISFFSFDMCEGLVVMLLLQPVVASAWKSCSSNCTGRMKWLRCSRNQSKLCPQGNRSKLCPQSNRSQLWPKLLLILFPGYYQILLFPGKRVNFVQVSGTGFLGTLFGW